LHRRTTFSSVQFSPDGSVLAAVDADGVSLRRTVGRAELRRLAAPGVIAASFSPRGTYLVTFQRPASKAAEGAAEPNLKARGRPPPPCAAMPSEQPCC
jgi:uncharacterized protein with WD repeat